MRLLPLIFITLFAVSCPRGAPQDAATQAPPPAQQKVAKAKAQPYAGTVTAWADPLLMVPLEAVGADLDKWYGIKLELTSVDRGELLTRIENGDLDNLPDVFFVGHPDLFTALREAGVVNEADARTFAGDLMAIVQKRDGGYLIKGELFDMYKLFFDHFGLGEDTTTAGLYGYQALYTCGIYSRLEERYVMLPTSQAIIDALEAEEVELAIMAASTATQTPKLEVLRVIDETYYEDIRYLAVPTNSDTPNSTISELLRLLAEDAGVQHALMGYGLLDRTAAMDETK